MKDKLKPSEWNHEKNSDRGTKTNDDITGDEKAPINFFVDEELVGVVTWSYVVTKHLNNGFICFGAMPK